MASENASFQCKNPHLSKTNDDFLYHLGLSMQDSDILKEFGDVKVVIVGGSADRMRRYANELPGQASENLSRNPDRFSMYKSGPFLCVNHGMGIPSLSIALHETFKLLHYAGCTQKVIFFRLGTCGGIGVEPGTVVISDKVVDGLCRPEFELHILGEVETRSTKFDQQLILNLVDIAESFNTFPVACGTTMTCDDFYETQARTDGAICSYSEDDKLQFLNNIHRDHNVRNIEMEALGFSALCNHLGIKAGVISVALLNRLKTDTIDCIPADFENRLLKIVVEYYNRFLQN